MSISKWKIALRYLTGGMGAVTDYLLDVLNNALRQIDAADKVKVQAALNVAERVVATLRTLQWLCPTRWQTAYGKTAFAAAEVVLALQDLTLTAEELAGVTATFGAAVAAWKEPDGDAEVE